MYKIIASGSKGNAIIYFDTIMVDCGIPYSLLTPYVNKLNLVLLTHAHGDHLNISTIKSLSFDRPSLRFGCGSHLIQHLAGVRNVDVYEVGKMYDYGTFRISPVKLYHDVENFGYRIFKGDKKVFHATDTFTLQGISAVGYNIYAIEANYDEDRVLDVITDKQMRGEYAYQRGAINSHLSMQQAQNFVLRNGVFGRYDFVQLHQSSEY